MHYIVHNYSDGTTEWAEKLNEIPKLFLVQYWPWTDNHEPQPMVVARYELVEVVTGELPSKKINDRVRKVSAKIKKVFDEDFTSDTGNAEAK